MAKKHWNKITADGWILGYELDGHRLMKDGRKWRLICDDGREFDMGSRATFDQAEALIAGAS